MSTSARTGSASTPAVDYDETVAAIQEVVDGYPGLFHDVQTYLNERIDEVLTGPSEAFVVRIFGDDLKVLAPQGRRGGGAASRTIDGIVDLHVELQAEVPQIEVEVRPRRGQSATESSRAMCAGRRQHDRRAKRSATSSEAGKAYDVNVWSTPETRHSLTSIRELPIDTPDGGHVRLGDVADVRIVPAQNVI